MADPRHINDAALQLIKSFESCRLDAYQDGAGIWTQGWGHTDGITADSPDITQDQADEWLSDDLLNAEAAVQRLIEVVLTDNQYGALVSLTYNAGTAPLKRTLGTKLNAGDYAGAADQFMAWKMSGGVISDGLVRRRTAERALFLTL